MCLEWLFNHDEFKRSLEIDREISRQWEKKMNHRELHQAQEPDPTYGIRKSKAIKIKSPHRPVSTSPTRLQVKSVKELKNKTSSSVERDFKRYYQRYGDS